MADLLFDPSSAMLSIALDTLLQLTENSNASQPNCVYASSVFKCTCVSECVCVCVCAGCVYVVSTQWASQVTDATTVDSLEQFSRRTLKQKQMNMISDIGT